MAEQSTASLVLAMLSPKALIQLLSTASYQRNQLPDARTAMALADTNAGGLWVEPITVLLQSNSSVDAGTIQVADIAALQRVILVERSKQHNIVCHQRTPFCSKISLFSCYHSHHISNMFDQHATRPALHQQGLQIHSM